MNEKRRSHDVFFNGTKEDKLSKWRSELEQRLNALYNFAQRYRNVNMLTDIMKQLTILSTPGLKRKVLKSIETKIEELEESTGEYNVRSR